MKKRTTKLAALALASVMAIGVLAGCSGGSNASGGSTEGGEKVLNFGCQMYSDGIISPLADTSAAWNFTRMGAGECLFKFDDEMNAIPQLLESYETTDNITFVLKIKEGIKFSDGCDMTASKVAESLNYMLAEGPNGSSTPEKYLPYESVVTADDAANTVTIVLPAANANLPGNLAYPVTAIVDIEHTGNIKEQPIGTGPYVIAEYKDQIGYTMVKNEYYREAVPYDRINIMFMGDASAKAMALRNGQVDLVENITNIADIQAFQADTENFKVDIAPGVRTGFSWINFNGVLGNDALRKAIIMAIDSETICKSNTIGGLYTAGPAVLPSSLAYGYENLNDPYQYNEEGAKKLLDEAGIVDTDGDGIRELNGQNINLRYVSYDARLLNDFADANTQYLTKIGIGVTADYGSSDDQWTKLVAGEYDFNNNNWTTVGNGDPTEFMANWYSKSNSNYCGYKNADYDNLYETFLAETDKAVRANLLEQMQQILIDDAAAVVEGYYNSSMIYSTKTVGYAHIHTADYYWITAEIVPAQ